MTWLISWDKWNLQFTLKFSMKSSKGLCFKQQLLVPRITSYKMWWIIISLLHLGINVKLREQCPKND